MNISLSVLSCLFEWKYSHTSWKATPLPQGFPRHLQSRQKGSIFYERPLMCWALGLAFLHLNLAKLAIPPELCIVLIQQQEAAAQHRASSQSNRYPTSHKPWWRLMVVEVSDCNSHSAGTTPSFVDLTPAQSTETVKWETRTEKQMGAIYPGSSHEHLPGKSD